MGKDIKFGGKATMKDKMKAVEDRYGKTTGASKGSKPAPKMKVKVRPTGGLKALQGKGGAKLTITKKF
jgi:hypothetical protein